MFCAAHAPEPGSRVHLGDTGDLVCRSCDGADGCAMAIYVINPCLGVFNQFLCFNPSLVQGHGEVDLKFELER